MSKTITLRWRDRAGFDVEAHDLTVADTCPACGSASRRVLGLDDRNRAFVPVKCTRAMDVDALWHPVHCSTVYARPAFALERPAPLRVPIESLPTPVVAPMATTPVAFGRTDSRQAELARDDEDALRELERIIARPTLWKRALNALRSLVWGWMCI